MPTGRRARFGGRGRERAWWLLAAAVLFAVLWAVGQVLAWPVWARATLAGLAAAVALVVPELRAWLKIADERSGLLRETVTVLAGPGRLPLVRDVGLTPLRVHAAQVAVPYIDRDVQEEVAEALGPGRAVLLVGHSMAGKTRLTAQGGGGVGGARRRVPACRARRGRASCTSTWGPRQGWILWKRTPYRGPHVPACIRTSSACRALTPPILLRSPQSQPWVPLHRAEAILQLAGVDRRDDLILRQPELRASGLVAQRRALALLADHR